MGRSKEEGVARGVRRDRGAATLTRDGPCAGPRAGLPQPAPAPLVSLRRSGCGWCEHGTWGMSMVHGSCMGHGWQCSLIADHHIILSTIFLHFAPCISSSPSLSSLPLPDQSSHPACHAIDLSLYLSFFLSFSVSFPSTILLPAAPLFSSGRSFPHVFNAIATPRHGTPRRFFRSRRPLDHHS